jgi:hypothetical protein
MNRNQKPLPNIVEAMNDPLLFGPWFAKRWFKSDSWATWRVFLKALYALPMTSAELEVYKSFTGRSKAPTEPFKKAWLICGRRGGKSRIAALVATYNTAFRKYPELQRGEVGVMPVIAQDRKQADVIFNYCANFFREIPLLNKMVVAQMKDSLTLSNGTRLEVQTCDHRSVRGFTMLGGILDELAFWPTDEHSASPDTEVINAVEKGSVNILSAMLLGVSSPYSRVGALWEAYQNHYGKDDSDELVWKSDSRSMNPTLSQKIIDRAYEKDAQQAAAEYGGHFRSDLANFLTPEAIVACVFAGRYELAPRPNFSYYAFCDPSGGSSDSMTLAVAHHENNLAMLDMVREIVPPFVPETVVKDFVTEAKRYHCYTVVGDRYAAEWVAQTFAKFGITYQQSEKTKSDIYLSLLPAINSRQVELLDHKKLLQQLAGLERRTRSGGKDSVDHRPGLHDDVANACAGALVLAGAGAGVYGLLDYDAKIASGEIRELPFGAPGAPPRAKIVQGEAQITQSLRSDGAVITRAAHSQEEACPPCAKCRSSACMTRCGKNQFWCSACGVATGEAVTMKSFDRNDVLYGRVTGAVVSGSGSPRRGRFGRFG